MMLNNSVSYEGFSLPGQSYASDESGDKNADPAFSNRFNKDVGNIRSGESTLPPADATRAESVLSEIKNAAIALLAKREHSREELKIKLLRKYSDTDEIEKQLEHLAQLGVQSEERFVESYVHLKKKQGKGPNYIKKELKRRGISDFLIAAYVYDRDEEWLDLASSVYQKKFGNTPIKDNKEKAKRVRFMVSRGFTPGNVFPTLNNYSEME